MSTDKNKKVLIVSLKAGAGHIKAAEAIEKAIASSKSASNKQNIEVKNIDFLDYASVLSKKFYTQWYIDLVKWAPKFYDYLYHNIDSSSTTFRMIFDRINAQKFKDLILEFKPDIVICTHFVPANLLTYWREKYGLDYKVWLTVTDYEAHKLWIDKEVDLYSVATKDVKDYLIKEGIQSRKIKVTGIPVDLKFSQKYNKKDIFKKLGLKEGFTVSVFSGGFGMGPIGEIFRNILDIGNINIIAVAGKNTELKEILEELAGENKNVKIFGFVNNIEELMAVSDLIISKPGGLTVSESLAMGIPLIMANPIPGQEEANSDFLLKNKAGLRADKPEGIERIVKKILKDKKILVELKRNIKKIAKSNAVVDLIRNIG